MAESQAYTVLGDSYYDDPSQLSQALRQRAGSEKSLHFTSTTESHQSLIVPPVVFAVPQQPEQPAARSLLLPVVPPPERAHSPRRAAPAKYVRPTLSQHHSAPTSTGFIDHKRGALKMHHTFNGLDAPGDTQPDSQMHKQYTSGIYSSILAANDVSHMPKSLFLEHEDVEENDPPTDELDVVDSSQDLAAQTVTSPTIVDVDDHGLHAHNSMAPTSPLKFETPALAGRKRDNSGNMLSSAMRTNTTPGTVASISAFATDFGAFGGGGIGGGPQISLTQAFNNTQAPTSPALGPINEDVVFQRPSPNFSHARHSSPIQAYSSPTKAPRPETPRSDPIVRSSSEPHSEYVTLKESQDRRKLDAEDARVSDVEEEDSWNELSRQVQARKRKEEFHRQAARSLSHISAPQITSPRARKKRETNAIYPSPDVSRVERSIGHGDRGHEDEDETDYAFSGYQVKVPSHEAEGTASTPIAARTVVQHNSNENRVQVPKTSSHPYQTPSGPTTRRNSSHLTSPSSQLQHESQNHLSRSQPLLRSTLRPHSSKESIAVMDSQPDVFAEFDSIPPPKSLRFPSSPSQNLYSINQTSVLQAKTGYTSQVVSSSMPPMPPNSTSDSEEGTDDEVSIEMDEDRVPSSPPMLTHDEDEEIGERTYDEYAEEIVEQEVPDSPPPDADDTMVDPEEPRIVKEELEDGEAGATTHRDSDIDDLDFVPPQKVDPETHLKFEEMMDREQHAVIAEDEVNDDQEGRTSVSSGDAPRIGRHDTIPETDALEEPQLPDGFEADLTTHNTDNTHETRTASEEQHDSRNNQEIPHSSKTDESDTIATGQRIQSVNDIYNLPDTQRSIVEEEIEMPQLSGLNEEDELASPRPRSPKRRKVTYASKQTATASAPLSDPPLSPLRERRSDQIGGSSQYQEQEGAAAAARARQKAQSSYRPLATLKAKAGPRQTRNQVQKKGGLKAVSRQLLQSLSSPANSPSKHRETAAQPPVTPTKRSPKTPTAAANVEMPDTEHKLDESAVSTSQPNSIERTLDRLSQEAISSSMGKMLVPNRVFALWPTGNYYPATCVGRDPLSGQLRVRFDDGNEAMRDVVQVRAFELRIGDHVKVDEPGMKKPIYVVTGLKNKMDGLNEEAFPLTDRYGHTVADLQEKQRESMPQAKVVAPVQQISVSMGRLYLTTGLWSRLRDRSFKFAQPVSPAKSVSHIGTPVADAVTTPSYTRRNTMMPSLLKDVAVRAASVASTTRSGTGVFSNMAFVLTSIDAQVDKDALALTLKTNGGLVLDQGFHELFIFDVCDAASSQGRRQSTSLVDGSTGLVLKDAYKDLGFVALITDSHSRSRKYIQALALNVPCLHLRWVQDSLSASCAKPFMRYLLPAGVSKFLDPHGVIRSRTMQAYNPAAEDISFAQTLRDRELLFRDQSLLLVSGKSKKKDTEHSRSLAFLAHALGAANVGRCVELAAASESLTNGYQWDWVYVDIDDCSIAEATAELFGIEQEEPINKAKKSKKRKRDETEAPEELMIPVELGGHKIHVTSSEFVIQSLILGALIEE